MAKSADAFRTISEVADWLGVPTHVLRFWESKFPQVKPVKRAGGRRYYRPSDMILLAGIRVLLHDDGVTIRGVQKILREKGVKHVAGLADREVTGSDDTAPDTAPDTASAKPDGGDTAKVVDLPRKSSPEPVVEKPQTTAPAATEEPTPAAEPAETPAEASESPGAEAADADGDAGQMPLFASGTAAPERPEPDTAATAPAAASTPDAADTHPPAAGRMPDLPGPSPASRAALGPVVTRIATGTGPEAERLRTALAAHRDALEALRARLSDAPQTPGSDAEG